MLISTAIPIDQWDFHCIWERAPFIEKLCAKSNSEINNFMEGKLTVYHTFPEFKELVWFAFFSCKLWNEWKWHRVMTPAKSKHDVDSYCKCLLTRICNTHASCILLTIEVSGLFFTTDAYFAHWWVAICCE